MKTIGTLVFCITLATPWATASAVPAQAHFNGYLNNAVGEPIDCPDALQCAFPVNIGFALYDSEESDVPLWEETHTSVPIYQGSFHVELGSLNDIEPSTAGDARYLSVSINGAAEMLPRLSLNSAVFAMRAAQAETAVDAENAAQLGGMEPDHYATLESVTILETGLATVATTGSYNDLTDVPEDLANGDDNTQLDESQVDAFVENNGYAAQDDLTNLSSSLAVIATSGSFNDLSDVPAGLADGDDNTQLSETEVDAYVANNGYAMDAEVSLVGKTGLYTDLLSAPWVDNAGHLEHMGTLSLLGPAGSINVTLGSKDTLDEAEKGQLLIHDADGGKAGILNVGTDGAGMLVLNGPNGELNFGIWNQLGSPNRAYFSLHGEAGSTRFSTEITENDVAQVFTFGPNELINLALWSQGNDHNDGLLSVFNDTGEATTHMGVTNSNAGYLQLKGPSGNQIAWISSYATKPDSGTLILYNDTEVPIVRLDALDTSAGSVRTYGPNGTTTLALNSYSGSPDHGAIALYDDTEVIRGRLDVFGDTNHGALRLYGSNGKQNVYLSAYSTLPDLGAMLLYDDTERVQIRLDMDANKAGQVRTYGTNGQLNSYMGFASWINGDHGYVAANNAAGDSVVGFYVDEAGNGVVFGGIKNFRMDHPEDPQKEIWYACIEGPEAAAYARGTGTLVNGHARIELPEHFRLIAAEEGLTVIVTPLSADSKGMAVVEKTPSGFRVRELMSGRGSYSFDWEIKGVRRGFEDYQVIRPAMKLAGGGEPGPEAVNTAPSD